MAIATDAVVVIRSTRAPAVTAALAAAAGICVSRAWPGYFALWWTAAALCAVLWCGLRRWVFPRGSAWLLVLGWMSLSAAAHDFAWSWIPAHEISRLATDEGVSVRLEVKVLEPAWIVAPQARESVPSWRPPERTLTTVEVRSLNAESQQVSVSGRLRLSLTGHYPELTCGDVIAVVGKLRLPAEPLNPGDFDYRSWLNAQRMRAVLHVESTQCIQFMRRESFPADVWGRVRQALRLRARTLFLTSLSEETSGVAETLLLGGRQRLDDELRQAFVNSGMLHVLAISGVNVALLALWLTALARLAGVSSRRCLMISTVGLVAYAAVTDGDPPVVRATAMALLGMAALWSGRQVPLIQVVAVALLAMMIARPTDLFDAGAQLSFLSVLAISWTLTTWQKQEQSRAKAEPPLVPARRWPGWVSGSWRLWRDCTLVSLGIWLVTAPLVAWRFQMVSLVGLVLNVILAPLIVVLMWAGYSFLIVGLLIPVAAAPFAVIFDACLTALIRTVTWASTLRFNHIDLASPPAWWMVGFYGMVGLLLLWGPHFHRQRNLVFVLGVWSAVGLVAGLWPNSSSGLSCRFLAVGHGLSVLVELPGGKTLLYDAGSLGDGERAARIVANEIRRRGRRRIDALIISHADADHCNALPRLIDDIPIGRVLIGPGFLDDDFPLPVEIVEQCQRKKIPVEVLAAGHRLGLSPEVDIRILHPPERFISDKDNPLSLVTALEYRGRRLLLTGDVEGDGLAELLRLPKLDCDVLLSPHHGSKAANPRRLAQWATPEWVVASTEDAAAEDRLGEIYAGESTVLATARRGAIEFHIAPQGQMSVETYRHQSPPSPTAGRFRQNVKH